MTITLNIQKNISTPTEEKNKFSEFAGIWKDRDITQESIREQYNWKNDFVKYYLEFTLLCS